MNLNIMEGLSQSSVLHRARDRRRVRDLLAADDAYATTMLILSCDALGPECLGWHPSALLREVETAYAVHLPRGTADRLMAAVAVVTTDLFYRDVVRFIHLANVLSGSEFRPNSFDPADAVECAWAITEVLLLDPPDEDRTEIFSDDIRRYVGLVLRWDGFVVPPDVLRIAVDHETFYDNAKDNVGDDAELFEEVRASQQVKIKEVETVVFDRLQELSSQLDGLTLQNGNTDDFVSRLKTITRN